MPLITDLITPGGLRMVLHQYHRTFGCPFFILLPDGSKCMSMPEEAHPEDIHMTPLLVRDSHVGYAAAPSGREEHLSFVVRNLSFILEQSFEIESLAAEVARNYEEISLLWRVSSSLASVLNVEKVCSIVAAEVMGVCPAKSAVILLSRDISFEIMPSSGHTTREKHSTPFTVSVALGEYAARAHGMILDPAEGLVGTACERKEPLTVCNVLEDRRFEGFPYPVTRLLVVPLIVEDKVIGAIAVTDKLNGDEFYSTEIKLISCLASECAVSIKKASLFEEIRALLFSAAEAFAYAIEAKDPYTYGHSRQVADLAVKISHEAGIPDDVREWLRLAALLHDIGKIGTPEAILNKRERLTEDEFTQVRKHPMIGAKVIRHVEKLGEIAKWICHHHEKYDGSGYPAGLVGEDIPLVSRIIAVADVFDALTSDRPYRKSYSREKAVEIMRQSVGKQLDPALFSCFERCLDGDEG
jgi:putative nucleotidyltransferase with HDIG domain